MSAVPRDRLSLDDLARSSGVEAREIERFVELGLIVPDGTDGTFDPGDLTRVKLLLALERSGIALDELAAAVRDGGASLRFAGALIADPVGLTTESHADVISRLGLDPDFVHRARLALTLPVASRSELVREDDWELLEIIDAALSSGVDEDALLRLLRIFGINLRQVVEVQRELFREHVEGPLLATGMSYQEVLDATAPTRLQLQRLGYRVVFLLLRRYLEGAVFENVVDRIETMLAEQGIIVRDEERFRSVVFVDLSGYTRITEDAGDEVTAGYGTQLLEIALDVAGASDGRVVKTLGDGVMLHFPEATGATLAALEIVDGARRRGLPPARAGIATGPVVQRDGDLFGSTVNLAARLVDVAEPDRVLTSGSVVERADRDRLEFRSVGASSLEGFEASIPVFAASRNDDA